MIFQYITKKTNEFKKYRCKVLLKLKNNNLKTLHNIRKEFNSKIDELETEQKLIIPKIDNRKKIIKLSKHIKDSKPYILQGIEFGKDLFKDSKYKYNIVIFLKSNKIKSFSIHENPKLGGFIFKNGYYNIDKKAIMNQNNSTFSFYLEGVGAPIDFSTANFYRDDNTFDIELSTTNLKTIVDGKAFEGIINLGKPSKGFFEGIDTKMALIGIAIIIVTILQYTGQIDLMSMLALK